ncbi:MAG: dihydrofolate reductase [Muribaculum sp.]|nr:dihydrofolate reductase [Muribaculum sp.]
MITIIVAITKDFAIGNKGDLLFHISEDLKRFKALTMGHPIIMGRKTFESFPKGALPGRRNIVVTRNLSYSAKGIEIASSLEEAIALCKNCEQVFIIGGGEIYRQALPLADKIELTIINAEMPEADTRFPNLNSSDWKVEEQIFDREDPKIGIKYRFCTVKRCKKLI